MRPILYVFKFILGVGIGLALGCLAGALLAPAAGEDTRRRLRATVSGEGEANSTGAAPGPIGGGTVSRAIGGLVGLLTNPRARIQLAMDEAREERAVSERSMRAAFETARQTGRHRD